MPPRAFGAYEVLARLATGGAANIFLARQARPKGARLVCLKTLLPQRAADPEFVEMFLDEARIAARLRHPSCVEIYDLGKNGDTYYLSMEYIFGETLWALLATVAEVRRPLPPPVVASIVASACDGLHHAHEVRDDGGRSFNLVHRDISPQNIMVVFDGSTKLLDFGIMKAETGRQATATGIVKGKFSYMSPEQITGGTIDRRSDLYSLGIVMFECLASRRLYRGDTPEDIARLMLERRPPRLKDLVSDIHPDLDAICAKALSRHPKNRFSSAEELAAALREHLASIGFDRGPEPVTELVRERFGDRIDRRRRIHKQAIDGNYDETELISVLGARAVMALDLAGADPSANEDSDLGPAAARSAKPGFRAAEDRQRSPMLLKEARPLDAISDVGTASVVRMDSGSLDGQATVFDPARPDSRESSFVQENTDNSSDPSSETQREFEAQPNRIPMPKAVDVVESRSAPHSSTVESPELPRFGSTRSSSKGTEDRTGPAEISGGTNPWAGDQERTPFLGAKHRPEEPKLSGVLEPASIGSGFAGQTGHSARDRGAEEIQVSGMPGLATAAPIPAEVRALRGRSAALIQEKSDHANPRAPVPRVPTVPPTQISMTRPDELESPPSSRRRAPIGFDAPPSSTPSVAKEPPLSPASPTSSSYPVQQATAPILHYSAGVVLAALVFGITVGLLLGVVLSLYL